jgi:Zn-dependent protease
MIEKYSISVGSLYKVPIRIHFTATPLLLLFYVTHWWVPPIYIIFLLVHEFGHVRAAQRLRYHVKEVEINCFGATATAQIPRKPKHEFMIALAGPFASASLMLFFLGLYIIHPTEFVAWCFALNFLMCFFNLLPIFPLDGGRMLRALWVPKYGRKEANRRMYWLSTVLLGIVGAGLLYIGNYIAPILCGLIWWSLRDPKQWGCIEEYRTTISAAAVSVTHWTGRRVTVPIMTTAEDAELRARHLLYLTLVKDALDD